MKKQIIIEGVICTITVTLNAKSEQRTGHNRMLHDEYTYSVSLHRVSIDVDTEYIYAAQHHCETKDLEKTIAELEKKACSFICNKKHKDDPGREEELLLKLGFNRL